MNPDVSDNIVQSVFPIGMRKFGVYYQLHWQVGMNRKPGTGFFIKFPRLPASNTQH